MSALTVKQIIEKSVSVKQAIMQNDSLMDTIFQVSETITEALRNDHHVWFCGNGGSAADAQHIAAELSGRFYYDRPPLFAEALHVNTSYLTAVANDYSYNEIYARLMRAKGRKGDVLVGISTSGNSENVIRAMKVAKEKGLINVAWTGETGGKMKACADLLINVPSTDTPRIQESHIMIGHIICEIVEQNLFPKS